MEKYIPLDAVVAEIDKFMYGANLEADIASTGECFNEKIAEAKYQLCKQIKDKINTLEVKEADTWHLQEKEDIYDAVKDWSLHTFVCVMKDGTIQKFTGCMDEDCEGHINVYIYGVNDDYNNDDIVKWIEFT